MLQCWRGPPSLVLQTPHPSNGVNKIQAGNLDLVVEHKNAKDSDFETIEAKTNLFKDVSGTEMKWE